MCYVLSLQWEQMWLKSAHSYPGKYQVVVGTASLHSHYKFILQLYTLCPVIFGSYFRKGLTAEASSKVH